MLWNRLFFAAAVLWTVWVLAWPHFALQQDRREAIREAAVTAQVCLHQAGLTSADCARDQALYQERLLRQVSPPGLNSYQIFAGPGFNEACGFMSLLIFLPLLFVYLIGRLAVTAGQVYRALLPGS